MVPPPQVEKTAASRSGNGAAYLFVRRAKEEE